VTFDTEMFRIRKLRPALWFALLITLVAGDAGGAGQTEPEERIGRVEHGLLPRAIPKGRTGVRASIAERMAYHGIPAMSMAVIDEGRVVWSRAYGVRGRNDETPVTPDTFFQAASLSKPVSALGALLLVQRLGLELDADLRPVLPLWTPGQSVTLRQLLSHTAGLNVPGVSGYVPGVPLPNVLEILNGEPPANNEPIRVTSEPGANVVYSGGGYIAVQHLVMELTRLPFNDYMKQGVFSPLAMTHSSFEQPLPEDRAGSAAIGHRRDGSRLQGGWMIHPELAAAGLWTTPSDLARIVIEVQDAAAGRPSRILQPELAREMLTGRTENAGLGFFLTGPNGLSRRFMHTGRNMGYDSIVVAYKNGRQGAVVMINRNNNEGFINEVLDSVAREYQWPDFVSPMPQQEYEEVPAAIQRTYAGVYEVPGRPRMMVIHEDDKLFARIGDDAWFRMYPESTVEFLTTTNDTRWRFEASPDGQVQGVIARSGGVDVRWRRQ
jgi:CubicO group peptidase (beta-lactamase class C family)